MIMPILEEDPPEKSPKSAVLRRCIWDTQPLRSAPKTGKEICVFCAEIMKAQRNKNIFARVFIALVPVTFRRSLVAGKCCITGVRGRELRLQTKHEHDLESATICRTTMPACHNLPRSRLPPLFCGMPACTIVHR